MPINNMQEAIEVVVYTLRDEFTSQGVNEEQVKKVIEDLIESINYNVKWSLKCQ